MNNTAGDWFGNLQKFQVDIRTNDALEIIIVLWLASLYTLVVYGYAYKKVRPYTIAGIVATLLAGSFLYFPFSKTMSPCEVQSNLPLQEDRVLRVTLCSQALERDNIVFVKRSVPQPVRVRFAKSTLDMHGAQLSGLIAEDFVTLQEINASDLYFTIEPKNEMFQKYGLHLVPLDFTIEYAKIDVPTE